MQICYPFRHAYTHAQAQKGHRLFRYIDEKKLTWFSLNCDQNKKPWQCMPHSHLDHSQAWYLSGLSLYGQRKSNFRETTGMKQRESTEFQINYLNRNRNYKFLKSCTENRGYEVYWVLTTRKKHIHSTEYNNSKMETQKFYHHISTGCLTNEYWSEKTTTLIAKPASHKHLWT